MKRKSTLDEAVDRAYEIFDDFISKLPKDEQEARWQKLHDVVEQAVAEENVIAVLKDMQGNQTLTAFAAQIGVVPSSISEVYNGTRSPGPKILKALNLSKETTFRRWR